MTSKTDIAFLENQSAQIPSDGGLKIGAHLRDAVRNARPGTAIVEIGCWLGAGTAQLALGLCERSDDHHLTIHCFDNYRALEPEIPKAEKGGITLEVGQDTLPIVKELLSPFNAPIVFHQGPIEEQSWRGGPISVCVLDAPKGSKLFFSTIKEFGPSWIPGKTVIFLMDYYFWRKTGKDDHKAQMEFIEANPKHFSKPVPLHGSVVVTRYLEPFDFAKAPTKRQPR